MKELHIPKHFKNEELSSQVKKILIEIIKNEISINPNDELKLPKEEKLSEILGISRNTLRDVLKTLEEDGYISRKRSRGTLINSKIVKSTCRLDLEMELKDMIVEEGYDYKFKTVEISYRDEYNKNFKNSDGYLYIEKVFYADDEPVGYCIDRISRNVAELGSEKIDLLKQISHFEFLETYCNDFISCVLADITPVIPDKKLCSIFDIDRDQPLLFLEDIGFNTNNEIILHSDLYLKPGKLSYKILRKRT